MYFQQNNEEESDYKQNFGLKKMLYKYQHQNQQLRTQIKALTQRLQDIMSKKKNKTVPQPKNAQDKYKDFQTKLLKKQMHQLQQQIQQVNSQIKANKEKISDNKQQRITKVRNQLKNITGVVNELQTKLHKYQQQNAKNMKDKSVQPPPQNQSKVQSGLKILTTQDDFETKIYDMQFNLEEIRKRIRQLQRQKHAKNKNQLKKHLQYVDLGTKKRQLQQGAINKPIQDIQDNSNKRKGIWHMDYSQQNYNMIKQALQSLKKDKQVILTGIRQENDVLRNKLSKLKQQLSELQNQAVNIPLLPNTSRISRKVVSPMKLSNIRISQKLPNLQEHSYEVYNDKNIAPKKARKVQWTSSNLSGTGVSWSDSLLKSPIVGLNLWMDQYLIGLQFLHTMGQSSQHLQLAFKKITPIQYRLSGSDYLENLILHTSDDKIVGLQLFSKNGRNDSFGIKNKTKIFNFGIKSPEKPLFSYGKFIITSENASCIVKLGFEVL